jgi:hypothetical protein
MTKPRYIVKPRPDRYPGEFNVIDTKKVIAVVLGKPKAFCEAEAAKRNAQENNPRA